MPWLLTLELGVIFALLPPEAHPLGLFRLRLSYIRTLCEGRFVGKGGFPSPVPNHLNQAHDKGPRSHTAHQLFRACQLWLASAEK